MSYVFKISSFSSVTKDKPTAILTATRYDDNDDWIPCLPLPKPFPRYRCVGRNDGKEELPSTDDGPRNFWSAPTKAEEAEKKSIRDKYASARKIFRIAYADMLSHLSQRALSDFSASHLKFLEVIHEYINRAELRDLTYTNAEFWKDMDTINELLDQKNARDEAALRNQDGAMNAKLTQAIGE